jgi:hypothetical protein
MAVCANCGRPNRIDAWLCDQCGHRLYDPIVPRRGSERGRYSPRTKVVLCRRCKEGKVTEYSRTRPPREIDCPKCGGEKYRPIPYHWVLCVGCHGRGGNWVRGTFDPDYWEEHDECRGEGWKEPPA